MKINIKLTVQYDGTDFNGWQSQTGQIGSRTVQGELKEAVEKVVKEPIVLIGAGRTDAGVHARGQVANFFTSKPIPEDKWPAALNSILQDDIRIVDSREVPLNFHAQYNAVKKMYCYYILQSEYADVFVRHHTFHCSHELDVVSMNRAAEKLKGVRNFQSFCASGSKVDSFVRTVYQSEVFPQGTWVIFRITANGFLYKMVRTIVGTLLEIGKGKRDPEWMEQLIKIQDRGQAGPTAPPQGLVLEKVWYP